MSLNFNAEGEKPRFMFKPHEREAHVWVIYEYKDYKGPKGGYDAIGDYRLVDQGEEAVLTEKKLQNLCLIMNGRDRLENLGNLTKTRLLFNIVPKEQENGPTVIMFRTHDGKGVSKENAVLTIEKGVINEHA